MIVIPIKEAFIFSAQLDLKKSRDDLEREYKKKIVKMLLRFLTTYYKYRHGIRITLFVPKTYNDEEIIKPHVREDIGSGFDSSMDRKKCFFRKGEGLPGMAWAKAVAIDDVKTLVNSIQVDHIPEDAFKSKTALRDYYRKTYSMNDQTYERLGSMKNKIKSYMAVGYLTGQSRLGGVISVDSVNKDQFIDFETLKKHAKKSATIQRKTMGIFSGSVEKGESGSLSQDALSHVPNFDIGAFPDITKELKNLPEDADTDTMENTKKIIMVAAFQESFKERYALDFAKILYPLLVIIREIDKTLGER